MFIGVLDTITKMWKQPKYSTMDERISKMRYVHTAEYYSALRRKWMKVDDTMLSEKKDKCCLSPLTSEKDLK